MLTEKKEESVNADGDSMLIFEALKSNTTDKFLFNFMVYNLQYVLQLKENWHAIPNDNEFYL